jgi:hypothetical protein
MGHGICCAPLFSSSTLPDSPSLLTFTVAHAKGWKENATRDELEAYWSRELKKATTETECKTVCSCADVRVPMDSGDPAPGIFIHLEQIGSPAADIVYPYLKDGISGVKLGTPTSVETESRVFAASQSDLPHSYMSNRVSRR